MFNWFNSSCKLVEKSFSNNYRLSEVLELIKERKKSGFSSVCLDWEDGWAVHELASLLRAKKYNAWVENWSLAGMYLHVDWAPKR